MSWDPESKVVYHEGYLDGQNDLLRALGGATNGEPREVAMSGGQVERTYGLWCLGLNLGTAAALEKALMMGTYGFPPGEYAYSFICFACNRPMVPCDCGGENRFCPGKRCLHCEA